MGGFVRSSWGELFSLMEVIIITQSATRMGAAKPYRACASILAMIGLLLECIFTSSLEWKKGLAFNG